jgi:hypothetical protein
MPVKLSLQLPSLFYSKCESSIGLPLKFVLYLDVRIASVAVPILNTGVLISP